MQKLAAPTIGSLTVGLGILALVSALGIGQTLQGVPPGPPAQKVIAQQEVDRATHGAGTFRVYCASCHGVSAEGNGPMADYLRIPPTDLTGLARGHGGVFPEDEVYSAIDGRRSVRGHGPREMPVWGFGFQVPGRDNDQEAEVRERIQDLIAFLKSIQK